MLLGGRGSIYMDIPTSHAVNEIHTVYVETCIHYPFRFSGHFNDRQTSECYFGP